MKDVQDCEGCKHEKLLPENVFAWELICEVAPGLFDGLGGVNYGAIEWLITTYQIPDWQRREIHRKILAFVEVARER